MPLITRRHLLIAISLIVLILAAMATLLLADRHNLKSRSTMISVGMSQEQVEEQLGPPELVLSRRAGKGAALIWVDQFWQVDVVTDPDGRVESVGCMPSDSWYRRTVGRLIRYP